MRKKISFILLIIIVVLSCVAFSACSKHKHTYGEWKVITPPTCEQAGSRKHICACGLEEQGSVPALGHNYAEEWYSNETQHFKVCENGCNIQGELTNHLFGKWSWLDRGMNSFNMRYCSVCQKNNEIQVTDGLEYVDYSGGVTLKGIGNISDSEISIPYINRQGKIINSIANNAFSGCSDLTSIAIPESVTRIGEKAFSGCIGLRRITIPKSVTHIGADIFKNCGDLTIYCEVSGKPSGWDKNWNSGGSINVIWSK